MTGCSLQHITTFRLASAVRYVIHASPAFKNGMDYLEKGFNMSRSKRPLAEYWNA